MRKLREFLSIDVNCREDWNVIDKVRRETRRRLICRGRFDMLTTKKKTEELYFTWFDHDYLEFFIQISVKGEIFFKLEESHSEVIIN